jgi:hypothetical protein
MKIVRLVITLLTALILDGCANAPQQDTPGLAELVVLGGGMGGFLKSTLMPIGIDKETSVELVDGEKKKQAKSKTYYLEPGRHVVDVKCQLIIEGNPVWAHGKENISMDFKAGEKYTVDAELGEDKPGALGPVPTCVPKIVVQKNT